MNLDKKALRALYRQKRRDFFQSVPDQAAEAARNVAENFVDAFDVESGQSVVSYSALGSEIDPLPLQIALYQKERPIFCASHDCCDQGVIRFHQWTPEKMEEEALRFGEVPEAKFLLVPLVAFSENGARLGQGGGHYDRLLEKWRAQKSFTTIGLALECQRCDTLIEEQHDQRLDAVITEKKVYRFL
ncbi:MAG: 5-formyltetrahydrofolate cyclo-ligase [bacterium]|nr:5-formyltetrahydrofolate cyclo-ligase [bacterium]